MHRTYYLSDFVEDSLLDIKELYKDVKQDVIDAFTKIKYNFSRASKNIVDCVDDFFNKKKNVVYAPKKYWSLEDIVTDTTLEINPRYVPKVVYNYGSTNQTNAQNVTTQTLSNNNYVIPEQYVKAIETIGNNESENEVSQILLGKNQHKRWMKRIDELKNLTKKYDADVVQKYKCAVMKNKYLRYSKKQEYQEVLDALEKIKA